ncbi:MAG TPA: TetR/AcrR family transcriptional regulator [Methanocella sp.]|nr:TetR/AcrR family transcriptional regulator [Methanocella sp.]
MGRKAKDPEIRKKEIVDAAEQLFTEKGYDLTSVSDITGKVGLSHGAFFYYFKSKEDLYRSVIDSAIEHQFKDIMQLLDGVGDDPVRKLQTLIDLSINSQGRNDRLMKYLHKEGNASIHEEYMCRSEELLVPLVAEIVEDGVRKGLFDVTYPRECVELLLTVFDSLAHRRASLSPESYYRKMRALDSIIARSLGLREDTLSAKQRR